jgi:hypothetical protein
MSWSQDGLSGASELGKVGKERKEKYGWMRDFRRWGGELTADISFVRIEWIC